MQGRAVRRRWATTLAAGSLAVTSVGAMAPAVAGPEVPMAPPAPASPANPVAERAEDKIDPEVTAQVSAQNRADVWVRFAERPDLSRYADIADWDERGQAVVDALKKAAESSQKEVRAQLDDDGMTYEAFWATNSIRVQGAGSDLITSLASSGKVEGIYPTQEITPPDPEDAEQTMAPAAIEWGVNDVKAPEVWEEGVRGESIVVASIDTGAQYDHPALVDQYRGNQGDGTFDHNYNWFDAAGSSPEEPMDNDGHGSHVTGTMVGTDGGDNQIGVAPGATWISANGCCPNDAALIESGQWMLEPLDLNGENPDVSKRPHIINNSWGTTLPSNDPFMEDVIEAWAASGMFGVFANGNSGPGCETSGSPGSRIIAYSVGNHTQDHTIANSSGRGAGQDGEIKPNISAPGSAVRSSVPGGGYASYTGTSMASPHVSGVVALLWSAAPSLVGDIEGTRELLNGTAIDTEDLSCGGTAENNNVFGEGRIDALEALHSAPVGETGTLTGTVTDAETGEALSGAAIGIEGPLERDAVTDEEGTYTSLLTAGDYTVTASAFGYSTETVNAAVTAGETTTADIALTPVATSTVTGTVTDGSGYGFPLYARVAAEGTPAATYTDPETGEFSIDLPEGQAFTLDIEVQYPGYTVPSIEVTGGETGLEIGVPVDTATCVAPGYEFVVEGVTESFDGTTLPEGWEVVDHEGTGQVWAFDNPGGRENLTGGEGNFAIMDSDHYGNGTQDTSLVTPSTDMSDLAEPVVGFKQDWRSLGDRADVDVSIDGGETWETVLSQSTAVRGPDEQTVQLPMAAGESDVKVRFRHAEAGWDYWWQVDDVFLGNRACAPAGEGGYVVGHVTDADGEAVNGARVTNLDDEEESGVSAETPADENLADGFYWLFSAAPGTHPFEASARGYSSTTQDVTVQHADVVRADFELGSAFIEIDTEEIETYPRIGTSIEEQITFTNTGTGAAEVELSEKGGDFTILRADGSRMAAGGTSSAGSVAAQDDVLRIETETSVAAGAASRMSTQEEDMSVSRTASEEWVPLTNYPRVAMDNRVVSLDGSWYTLGGTTGSEAFADVNRYDPADMTWTAVAPMPSARSAVTAGAVDGQIIVSGGWIDSGVTGETIAYDPASDSWTEVATNPVAVSAAASAVLDGKLYSVGGCTTAECAPMSAEVSAYDAASDTWEQLADYPAAVAFASCGGVDGQLVCTGGNGGVDGTAASYSYDPGSDTWTALPDAPSDTWASQYAAANGQLVVNGGVQGGAVTNATFAYDSASGDWIDLPASGAAVYRGGAGCGIAKVGGSTGGFTPIDAAEQLPGYEDCGDTGTDVSWLEVDPMVFSLEAGESVEVTVVTDANVAQPGRYTAAIGVKANTPQDIADIPVTMNVQTPNNWGKIKGVVRGTSTEGDTSPLEGAVVDLTPHASGVGDGVALITDGDGAYAQWMVAGAYGIIAAKDDYRPQADETQIKRSQSVTENFTLKQIAR